VTTPLLAGKRILITGVLTPKSIAYSIAEACQQAGAELVLTGFGKALSLTERSARRLPQQPTVLELDATRPEHYEAVAAWIKKEWGGLDGAVHAIGFAPEDALGGNFLNTPWGSVATAMEISAFSMKTLSSTLAPLMTNGGSLVALTFDATVAWPLYDWMGPTKAALEAVVRYLSRDLGTQGIRVNSLSAGPLETMAAKSIPGFSGLKEMWSLQAPLGWDAADAAPVADTTVFLLSEMSRAISGEVLHVDGGYHAMGAPLRRVTAAE
jgi:enoyl-[acyl-carrier protein] reductase I